MDRRPGIQNEALDSRFRGNDEGGGNDKGLWYTSAVPPPSPTSSIRLAFLAILVLLCAPGQSASLPDSLRGTHESAVLVADDDGTPLLSLRPDQPLIPASTLKLLTALAALDKWGPEHRFQTDFFLTPNHRLVVRGHGDPFLISEEIDRIAGEIAERLPKRVIEGIDLDASAFSVDIKVDGQSDSDNPYDAPPGAIAANFNTVFVGRTGGRIRSMEPQTPLTRVARRIAASLPDGSRARVNIPDSSAGALHFAEILRKKLQTRGVQVADDIRFRRVQGTARLLYRHDNSHALDAVIRAMLKYSTNFIANQLFLMLGADGGPASMSRSRAAMKRYVANRFGWRGFEIHEGAGLSRQNRLTARQLTQLLEQFRPWANLLPEKIANIPGKTGTLTGVSCYAGYLGKTADAATVVLLLNDPAVATPAMRLRLLKGLRRALPTYRTARRSSDTAISP